MQTPMPETAPPKLPDLGWRQFYMQQLSTEEFETLQPVRILSVHRSNIRVIGQAGEASILPYHEDREDGLGQATVGDWLLTKGDSPQAVRMLDRISLFKRRAPGEGRKTQLIAANVDTLFITTSCNRDFNIARLERYLALAGEADVMPVIVLTKADETDSPETFETQAATLKRDLTVITLDGRDPAQAAKLLPWCGKGQTVAFVGSSGVGKSTLINTLLDNSDIKTQGLREDDAKGRHTTTHREMHRLAGGGWLIDTPGMRELQLTDVQTGIEELFSDIADLAHSCRFRDCEHQTEPGCAVRAAIDDGSLEPGRLVRWRKLAAEEAHNSDDLGTKRAKDRALGKMIRTALHAKKT